MNFRLEKNLSRVISSEMESKQHYLQKDHFFFF